MKNNNILTIILTLIVGISIGIFGLSFYQSLNNTDDNKPQQENGDNNQNDQGTNNNENDQVINVTMKEANKLF